MKKREIIKKDVYYCDICGQKVEKNVIDPYISFHYEDEFDNKIYDDRLEFSTKLDLCSFHSRCLGGIIYKKLKDALSFLEDDNKVKELIKQDEIGG